MDEGDKEHSSEELKAHILYKLTRRRIWGGKHIPIIYIRSGLPQKYRSHTDELVKELINYGLLIQAPKTGEIHVSLNPRRRKEILEITERYFGKIYW